MAVKKKTTVVKDPLQKKKRVKKDNSAEAQKRRKEAKRDYTKNKAKIKTERKKKAATMTPKEKKLKQERAFVNRLRNAGHSDAQIKARLKDYRAKKAGKPTSAVNRKKALSDLREKFAKRRDALKAAKTKAREAYKQTREKNKTKPTPAARKAANLKAKSAYQKRSAAITDQRKKLVQARKDAIAKIRTKFPASTKVKPAGAPAPKGTRAATKRGSKDGTKTATTKKTTTKKAAGAKTTTKKTTTKKAPAKTAGKKAAATKTTTEKKVTRRAKKA